MSAMRAGEPSFLEEEPTTAEPLITLRAGDNIMIRVGAVDRQSGLAEIVACCRSQENHDLASSGTWSPKASRSQQGDNYYPVVVNIPAYSPTVIWELHRIILRDREGNLRSYEAGKDFEGMLFQVLEKPGVDCTPPRLLGVRLGRA